jgi:hypothetical protein
MTDTSPRLPASFHPRQPASRAGRLLLLLFGPMVWLAALLVLAFVLDRRDAVEHALVVFAVSFLGALPVLAWSRAAREREGRGR